MADLLLGSGSGRPSRYAHGRLIGRVAALLLGAVALVGLVGLVGTTDAIAAPATPTSSGVGAPSWSTSPSSDGELIVAAPEPEQPQGPRGPRGPGGGDGGDVTVEFDDLTDKPSTPVLVLLGLTLLSLLPAILLTTTSFTKILVVLGLTRNALGLQQIPPNQVLAGLALFLSLFIMAPVFSEMNDLGLQPYLDGAKSQSQAWDDGIQPLREFMMRQTGDSELALLTEVADRERPETRADVPLSTLVPAFVLSELKQAFIIGFVIFIPFLVIDIVVSAALMSLGMMMMPPVMVSLPFKLLLFVMVDGWGLIVRSLVSSYGGG